MPMVEFQLLCEHKLHYRGRVPRAQVLEAKAADGAAMVDLAVSLVQTGFYQGLRTKGC
ncbi:hypothetical protein P389DRAFT_175939 [Cystobasidium minutum MCA 4210]|uniref:uncharacterized protein n=1 Tax=Cystobasidium minutum MCA 4210 TaxID=1397322 RepID=UPI0034CFAA4F|eukprot:jgi/Rhomi1/175939/fgenesh1_kg.12_\